VRVRAARGGQEGDRCGDGCAWSAWTNYLVVENEGREGCFRPARVWPGAQRARVGSVCLLALCLAITSLPA